MGFGDPYHKHPLRSLIFPTGDCFRCELPVASYGYGCQDCNYYIHNWCRDLLAFRHPLHDQHLLTPFEPSPDPSDSPNLLCSACQNPCVGPYSYQCTTCQLFFHLKCLFTLNHEKHQHLLIFTVSLQDGNCKICGSRSYGFGFGCRSCEFFIHLECSLIPLEIKHHHVHKLTLRHNFPEECDQVYCDLCEDRDGEMDRTQSFYYCKDCDYIAHVKCCHAQPREDLFLCERFTHEHPLRPVHTKRLLSCTQCSYTVSVNTNEYPSFVKNPRHPHHTLFFDSEPTNKFNCTECNFSMDEDEFVKFTHPLWKEDLEFACIYSLFRCDACGELGKGSRIRSVSEGLFDLHLECFALPGKLEHESHPNHPLYLRWRHKPTSRCCRICRNEMDPQLWFYFCQECDYVAHMYCVARDLLSTLRSSIKNQPDFCAIIEPDESSFTYRIADLRPRLKQLSHNEFTVPVLEGVYDTDLGTETDGYELPCPNCNSLIPTQAGYSNIRCWKSSFRKNSIGFANDQTPSVSEPLICCSICNLSIFPPTYSCPSCQIFFHKSCAELPRKILFNETTYVLRAPPFPEGLSNCWECEFPICGWSYLSSVDRIIFDVQCAAGAPLVNLSYHNDVLRYNVVPSSSERKCKACGNNLPEKGEFVMNCDDCGFDLHPECGLLPSVIKHRIHQHPLELATDLAELDCEYFCDVCEKDLNPDLWAYRCVDWCGFRAVSHVSCVITSKNKCHFSYDLECKTWTEEEKLKFRRRAKGEKVSDDEEVLELLKRFSILESE